jgi:hydroxyacylglutathione hydrolase
MKKLFVLYAVMVLFTFGCAHKEAATIKPEGKPVAKVDAITAGKEEGTIDKQFFKKIVADEPVNVSLVDVRTKFEYDAGHFAGARHVFINDLFDKGCDATLARFPKDGFIVFVCTTGARAGEMYFEIKDNCKYSDIDKMFFLDAEVAYTPKGPVIN